MSTPTTRRVLTAGMASAGVAAGLGRAADMGVAVTITVVDAGGHVVIVHRMDEAPLVSLETARLKAYSGAAIGIATDDFFAAISPDPAAVASFGTRPGLALIAGGLPVRVGDVVIGGVGVAGAMTGAEDRAIAEAAVAAALR